MLSKLGSLLAGVFLALSVLVISSQGLFYTPEALMLGLPWSLSLAWLPPALPLPVFVLYLLVLGPIALNVALLYAVGYAISAAYWKFVKGW